MTLIPDMDAISTAEKIKNGQLTSTEITTAYINQINTVNPSINAMVESRFTAALNEAAHADEQINRGETTGPLHGVPISVKEAFNVSGMKTTGGLEHRQDLIAKSDANVVTKLKDAGAIILGKTNTPALSFCQETENKLYGRTNNPWDYKRTAGGSSGGEGALLAAGGAAAGIGSDVGGSIRIPSHFNGVVGFKPAKDMVSDAGMFPMLEHPLQRRMLSVGPMGKSVRDMKLLYEIISGQPLISKTPSDIEISILPAEGNYPIAKHTQKLLHSLQAFLREDYVTRQETPPFFDDSALLWAEIMATGGSKQVEDEAYHNDRSHVAISFLKEKLTERTNVHPYLSWAILAAKFAKPSNKRVREIKHILHQNDAYLSQYLQRSVLIFPVYHTGALQHGKVFKELFSIRKTFLQYMPFVAYANVWGLPSLSLPVGVDENDMPISIQLMSATGNEDVLFQLGTLIEERYRGYIRCK